MLKIISYNKKTILSNLIELKICKRFYPKNPAEKIMGKIGQECIGAGCASTRPFMPPIVQENTQVSNAPNTNNTMAIDTKLPTLDASDYSKNNSNTIQDNKIRKDISKPIETIAEKYTENNNYATSTTSSITSETETSIEKYNRRVQQINRNYEDNSKQTENTVNHNLESTKPLNQESALVSEPSALLEPFVANVLGDAMLADIKPSEILLPPPLSPINNTNNTQESVPNILEDDTLPSEDSKLKKELQDAYKARQARDEDIKKKFKELEDRSLVIYQDNEEKTTAEFHKLINKDFTTKKPIIIEDFIKDFTLEVGMLQVTDIENTVLLDGKQKHVIVMCISQGEQRIVIGMLTSAKEGAFVLSEKQPFDFEDLNKKQRFVTFNQPLLIENNAFFKPLDNCTLDDGRIINQQQLGQDYINNPEIKQKIQKEIVEKVIPQIHRDNDLIFIYTGSGITEDVIDDVLKKHDIEAERRAQKYLQDYKKIKNELDETKMQRFIEGVKNKEDKKTFELVQRKIIEHENKYKN